MCVKRGDERKANGVDFINFYPMWGELGAVEAIEVVAGVTGQVVEEATEATEAASGKVQNQMAPPRKTRPTVRSEMARTSR